MSSAETREETTREPDDDVSRLDALRNRFGLLDHALRMVQHYGEVKGNALAGGVTYFGFLSFFPIMVLAFAVVGWVATYAGPDLVSTMVEAIRGVLPLIVEGDPEPGEISIQVFQDAAGAAAGIGVVTALYSGLGWLSGMRQAMMLTFELPQDKQPNFIVGKARDLASLITIGLVLVLSVVVAGGITFASTLLLELVGLGQEFAPLLTLLSIAVGLAANTLLFFAIYRLLANPAIPRQAMIQGAVLGAIGFEVLKQLAGFLIDQTTGQPAFAVFGIALILVVWINYFSRLLVYSASWAHTSPLARFERERLVRPEVIGDRVEAAGRAPVPAAPMYVEADKSAAARGRSLVALASAAIGIVAGVLLGNRRK